MTWQKFRRIDTYVSKNEPIISITKDRFNFNAFFVRTAAISSEYKVILHVDPPTFRVGFEFITKEDEDSLSLISTSKGKTGVGLSCSSKGIGAQFGI